MFHGFSAQKITNKPMLRKEEIHLRAMGSPEVNAPRLKVRQLVLNLRTPDGWIGLSRVPSNTV